MCEFVSWIEKKGEIYFLTDADLESRRGKELKKHCSNPEDLKGHGALLWFYGLSKKGAVQKECTDFSNPGNFPDVIVGSIKSMMMTKFDCPESLLSASAWNEYERIRAPIWNEYDKVFAGYERIQASAWAEYKKIEAPAWAEYKKIEAPALAEHERIKAEALAEYKRIKASALAEYKRIKASAWDEYKRIKASAWAEYKKIEAPAWAESKRITNQMFWDLFSDTKNRAEAWR